MDYALATTRLVDAALDVAEMLNQNKLDRIDDIDLRGRLMVLDQWARNYKATKKPKPRPEGGEDDFGFGPCG